MLQMTLFPMQFFLFGKGWEDAPDLALDFQKFDKKNWVQFSSLLITILK